MSEKEVKSEYPADMALFDTNFKQQRLAAWQPLLTPEYVATGMIVIGIICLPIGIAILAAANSIVEIRARYDDQCVGKTLCTISLDAPTADMKAPLYFYYELDNFYQNHRRYVKSRADGVLAGTAMTTKVAAEKDAASCDPAEHAPGGGIMYPCGLIASSYFNDSFSLLVNGVALEDDNWDKTKIAWKSDVTKRFVDKTADAQKFGWNLVDGFFGYDLPAQLYNSDFIVWMRTAGLPHFKKLYRKVATRDIMAGESLTVQIENLFHHGDDQVGGGSKWVSISTSSWIGGPNLCLAVTFIIVGCISILLAVILISMHFCCQQNRVLGSMEK